MIIFQMVFRGRVVGSKVPQQQIMAFFFFKNGSPHLGYNEKRNRREEKKRMKKYHYFQDLKLESESCCSNQITIKI